MIPSILQGQRGARIAYIDMDIILSNNKEFSTANIEDATTKIVKLIANLSTEEMYAQKDLKSEE